MTVMVRKHRTKNRTLIRSRGRELTGTRFLWSEDLLLACDPPRYAQIAKLREGMTTWER